VIDPRLVFLARAAARLTLVEVGEMTLSEAFDGLVPFAEGWEITHPPLKYRRNRISPLDPRCDPVGTNWRGSGRQCRGEVIPGRRP
jgi:hypothetical protein